jgi:quercetin dioxygenase-like cupin family protein
MSIPISLSAVRMPRALALALLATGGAIIPGTSAPLDAGGLAREGDAARVLELLVKDLEGVPGKEVEMITVDYPPGGSSPPHRHHAQVFVYVLSGSLRMQLAGSPLRIVGPGEIFYEARDDEHTVSANASQAEPAKFLVVKIQDKTPASTALPGRRFR